MGEPTVIRASRSQLKRTVLKGYSPATAIAALAIVIGSLGVLATAGAPQLSDLAWPLAVVVLAIAGIWAYHLLQLQSRIEVTDSEVRLVQVYGTRAIPRSAIAGIACRDVRGMVQMWRYAVLYDAAQHRLLVLDRAYWSDESLRRLAKLLGLATSLEPEPRTFGSLRREFSRR